MQIYGVKVDSTNITQIEAVLKEMKLLVHLRAQKLYADLLSKEIEILVDEIVRGMHENDNISSVFDAAVSLLNTKIAIAIAKGIDTEYNFSVAANILTYQKQTYIQIATCNHDLYEHMIDVKAVSVTDVSIDDGVDQETREKRYDMWEKIIAEYKDHSCMIVKMFPLSNNAFERPEFEQLHFNTPIQRAEVLARHQITNQLLHMYAGNGDVPPHKLMEYMDQAQLKLFDPQVVELTDQYKSDLLKFLPVITKDIVMTQMDKEGPGLKQKLDNILSQKTSDND